MLTKTRIIPATFAFYIVAFAAVFSTIFVFFDTTFRYPNELFWVMLLGGGTLFFGLYFMFLAVSKGEVSKVNPLVVSFVPMSVFILSFFLNLEQVSYEKIIGSALVVWAGYRLSQVGHKKDHLSGKIWMLVVVASFFLGASNVYSKIAYDHLSFISAFVWLRWFSLIVAVLFISCMNYWGEIFFKRDKTDKMPLKQAFSVLIVGQLAGCLGVVLLQVAIKLGNVILVTALNGIQFFFVIMMVYIISKNKPHILHEDISGNYFTYKVMLSLAMIAGVALILV